jgi:two-component system, OmpR family, phosphate regulon sensor histidine kinase PhoR
MRADKAQAMAGPAAADLIAVYPHAAILVDPAGNIAALNALAERHVPLARLSEPMAFAVRDPDMQEALLRVRQGQSARFELIDRRPPERAFDVQAAPAGDGFALIVLEDLTERRKLERLRVDFIANASHELRTPLASVLGFVETLRGPARGDPTAADRFLPIMEEQARRMARLVDDLLSLSRIELQAHVPPEGRVALQDAARQIIDGLRPRAREAGVALTLDAPQEPVEVRGDRDELLRALENLIENAIRYGASGRKVGVEIGTRGKDAYAAVRDHGPGILPEHLPRLTERFYRADAAASRQTGGTGLGLAIVKHIMLRHRGRLEIDSEVGRGSVFTLRFSRID